jgi:C-terminal processing protease CtpA/Prc
MNLTTRPPTGPLGLSTPCPPSSRRRAPRHLLWVWTALVVTFGLPLSLPAVEHAALAGALEAIRTSEIQRHVDVLADDSFEGREAGSRGGHAAANYLANLMESYDLLPAGESESYFQGFGANYRNVLGILEGSDPRLKNEVILVGAHYDHVGYGNASNSNGPIGQIHNGADDNASGVAGVLSLAAALQQLPTPPRRSILFVFWDGEEKGLLGSQHWTREPTIPLQQVVMALNVDMIGRLRDGRVEVYGSRTSLGLREALARANQDPEVWFDFQWEMKNNSDHYSFFERSIPSIMLHTGLHDQYHRPSDEAHTINAEGLRQVTTIMLRLVVDLANRESLGGFREQARQEGPIAQRQLRESLPLPGPRLGVSWSRSQDEPGLKVTHVAPGSAADRAQLRVGDRLLALNQWEIESEAEFRHRILAAREPVQLTIRRPALESERDFRESNPRFSSDAQSPPPPSQQAESRSRVVGEAAEAADGRARQLVETSFRTEQVIVSLDGSPARVGITWKTDDASPGLFLLSRVLPGSPAHDAGLKAGDWIYEVDGKACSTTEELIQRLQAPEQTVEGRTGEVQSAEGQTVEVLAERRGQLHLITITLPPAP